MTDKNFKQEACQLHIEQQIEERLAAGLTSYKVAKEITTWLNNVLGVEVKYNTIRVRADRYVHDLCTNVHKIEDLNDNQKKIIELYKNKKERTKKKNPRKKTGPTADQAKTPDFIESTVDSIVIVDQELITEIRSLAKESGLDEVGVIKYGVWTYKQQ